MFAGARRFDGRVERQQVGLAGDLFDDGDLVGDLLHRRHGFENPLAALLGVLGALVGDLVSLLRVVSVLLDVGDHLLHRRRSFFRRSGLGAGTLRHLHGRGEMDWLAAATSPAMERMSETVCVSPPTMETSACISLSCGERSRNVTVRLPLAISSAAAVISFMATISLFRLFLIGVEVAMVGVGNLRRNIALADQLHVIGRDIQWPDYRIENGVDAANDLGIGALYRSGLPRS